MTEGIEWGRYKSILTKGTTYALCGYSATPFDIEGRAIAVQHELDPPRSPAPKMYGVRSSKRRQVSIHKCTAANPEVTSASGT